MARAGTTVLLELLAKFDGFSSHTYRDVPFVLCPIVWDRLSHRYRRNGVAQLRRHADGLLVSYDSVEAFDEIAWRAFWPRHYAGNSIALWQDDRRDEAFELFFKRHMRKIVALRTRNGCGRYLSKNNANIARTCMLQRMAPGCRILVPFRQPVEQALSLHRQHLGALKLHAGSHFAQRYAEWVGHFEFGLARKQIAFPGLPEASDQEAQRAEYWLRYWMAAHMYLLQQEGLVFVSFDALCSSPDATLNAIGDLLGARVPADLSGKVRPPPAAATTDSFADARLVARATEVHATLCERSINC